MALCYSKLILLIRAQSETKTKETYCVIILLALQSLGTRDVCRSHTKLGMLLIALEEQRSKITQKYLPGLIMTHTIVVMKHIVLDLYHTMAYQMKTDTESFFFFLLLFYPM